MISKFNDATEMQIQSAEIIGGLLQIKAINTTPETLRQKFQDEFACKKIQVVEREQVIAEHENYTKLLRIEEYTGGIYGVALEKAGETTAGRHLRTIRNGGASMIYIARVYADLIQKEKKSIEDVPEKIREQVREILAGEG